MLNFKGELIDSHTSRDYTETKKEVHRVNLGERIYQLRTAKNLSQGALADALDVSRQSISKWENNTAVPELEKLVKLSEIFEVTLDQLVTGKEPEPVQEDGSKEVQTVAPAPNIGRQKLAGIILLCFGGLVWLLLTIFAGFLSGIILASPFLLCGVICLKAKSHGGLWCAWALLAPVHIYMRWGSMMNWRMVRYTFDCPSELGLIHIIMAWVELLCIVAIVAATVVQLGKKPLAVTGRSLALLAAGWVLFGVWPIPMYRWWWNQIPDILYVCYLWCRIPMLAALVTGTVRCIRGWRQQRQHT